jgi:hypothetical protein
MNPINITMEIYMQILQKMLKSTIIYEPNASIVMNVKKINY